MSLAFHPSFAVFAMGLPPIMLIAEGLHLRTGDPIWLTLARRWSNASAILLAVGAVSRTIISFELGLLRPRFSQIAGAIIGLPFSLEAFAFFGGYIGHAACRARVYVNDRRAAHPASDVLRAHDRITCRIQPARLISDRRPHSLPARAVSR